MLSNSLSGLQTQLDSEEWAYTSEEYAALREKQIALLHLFFENGDFNQPTLPYKVVVNDNTRNSFKHST